MSASALDDWSASDGEMDEAVDRSRSRSLRQKAAVLQQCHQQVQLYGCCRCRRFVEQRGEHSSSDGDEELRLWTSIEHMH